MSRITKDGSNLAGLILVDGAVPSTGGGGGPPSGPAGGDLGGTYPNPTVEAIDGRALPAAVPGEGESLRYEGGVWAYAPVPSPSFTITGSAVFPVNTPVTIYTYPMVEGEFQSVWVHNSVFRRGTGANVRSVQWRYWGQIKRPTGLGAIVAPATAAAQGDNGGTFTLVAVGNNVEVQVGFTIAATYFYNVPVYLNGGIAL